MLVSPIPLIAGISLILNAIYLSWSLYTSVASQTPTLDKVNTCHLDANNVINHVSIADDRWHAYHSIIGPNEGEWCHYPEYQTTFQFNETHYKNVYLDKHDATELCSHLYPIKFSISVDNSGYLTIYQCKNNTFQYSTNHTFDNKMTANGGVQLYWPDTYVYVWCDGEENPAFTTFHAPRPIDETMPSFEDENVPPNILFLQLDAIAYTRFAMTMPKTYQYLERLNAQQSPDIKVWKFNKFAVAGANSAPAFHSQYGHSRSARHPDNHAWLWRQAKEHGYMTAYAEGECWSRKYIAVGIDSTVQHSNQWFDYNWMSMYCGGFEHRFQEELPHCSRGKTNFKHIYDPLLQTMEYYQSRNRPVFLTSNMLEAHTEHGFPARHMDDDGYVEYLERLVNFPNTITIVHSDHGLHYGKYLSSSVLGTQDNRFPFMYITSTVKGYDIDQRNLNRLVTPFDIWMTISHLISGVDFINPINHDEINFDEAPLTTTVDLFRDVIPGTRTCQQTALPLQTCTDSVELYDNTAFCMCQNPFQLVCPVPSSMMLDQWNECTQAWSHPSVFDVEYYAERFGINDPCDAVVHWCMTGIHQRFQSKKDFNIARHIPPDRQNQTFRVLQNIVHLNGITENVKSKFKSAR